MTFSQALDYINSFSKTGKKVSGLSRISALMSDLENPQDKLKFIHIAGTNGKGSAAQMCFEILKSRKNSGKVGLFTSPYIFEFRDRIRLFDPENDFDSDYLISKSDLALFTQQVREKVENSVYKDSFSQFEVTMAVAFCYYKAKKTEIVVLETGLGGKFDCTNVVKNPLCELIMSLGFDHTAVLGETIEEIAFQKAGIIKPNTKCFMNSGNPENANKTVEDYAEQINSQVVYADKNALRNIKTKGIFGSEFEYKGKKYSLKMSGEHQIFNALTVIEAMKFLNVDENCIKKGLQNSSVAARQQVLCENPLVILDGSHNPNGVAALKSTVSKMSGKKIAVVGMLKDKAFGDALRLIADEFETVYCVDSFAPNAVGCEELAGQISNGKAFGSADKASFAKIFKLIKEENKTAVIFGSLYLASECLNYLKMFSNTNI